MNQYEDYIHNTTGARINIKTEVTSAKPGVTLNEVVRCMPAALLSCLLQGTAFPTP